MVKQRRPRLPKPPSKTVGVIVPIALLDRLATYEMRRCVRALSLSALLTKTLERWLDER